MLGRALTPRRVLEVKKGFKHLGKSDNHRKIIGKYKKNDGLPKFSDIFCYLLINDWLKLVN